MVPDYGFVFALTSAGPDANGLLLQVIFSEILEALVPSFEAANKLHAKGVYEGTYEAESDSITLVVDDGPGLLVTNFSVNGISNVIDSVGQLMGATTSDQTSLRLYPTNLIAGKQMVWQGVYDTLSKAEVLEGNAQLFFQQGTCQSWSEIALLSYGLEPLDHFVLTANDRGKNVAVDAKAWRTIMSRT